MDPEVESAESTEDGGNSLNVISEERKNINLMFRWQMFT